MSLATNVSELATRVGTELKTHKTLINGNSTDGLAALSTTAKQNLVAAINEVAASLATAAGIDDNTTSGSTTWSSQKTAGEITSASTADRDRANHTGTMSADDLVDGTTNYVFTTADDAKLAGIADGATANASDVDLRDRSTHTGTQLAESISDLDTKLAELKDDILGGAGAAYDTLGELQTLITDNAGLIDQLEAIAANKVSFEAQTLTGTQQTQARANIGAADAADLTALATGVGNVDQNFVVTLEAAL